MRANLERVVEIPLGVELSVSGDTIKLKKGSKELEKKFNVHKITLAASGSTLKISSENATRRESKMVGTIWAHVNNMIKGLEEEFVYKLEICNVHFPMNVKVEGTKVVIKSFLGERTQRISKILDSVKVEISGNEITVKSHDIEAAGQTAANLEKATRLTGRDRRIFQDGIFITSKPGGEI